MKPLHPAHIQEIANELGIDPLYLERDWVLTEIAYRLATDAQWRDEIVLKGGQALRHVYGSARLSKDADYVARRRNIAFAELCAALDIRYPMLHLPAKPVGSTGQSLKVSPIEYRGPVSNGSVEIEVSVRGDLIRAPERRSYRSAFREPFEVLVMRIDEMVAEKVRALYQRGNARDLYDLWFIFGMDRGIVIAPEEVTAILPEKFRLVSGGWQRERLFVRVEEQAETWDGTLRVLLPEFPSFDDALELAKRSLRFLPR